MPTQDTFVPAEIESQIRNRHIPDLPDHFVLPDYARFSVANIAPTAAGMFGIELEGAAPPLPDNLWTDLGQEVECVVLLLLDALGYLQLRQYMATETSVFNRLARCGRLFPVTSVFPSTTVSALSSIRTGRTPLEHGFLGTTLLLSEQGVLVNMLKLAPAAHTAAGSVEEWGWEPSRFVTTPSLAQELARAGIHTVVHTRLHFIASALTKILLRGVDDLRGYLQLSDLWINVRQTLTERSPDQRLLVDVYWSGIDDTVHVYGTGNPYIPSALRHFARSLEADFLATLPPEVRRSTLLIIAADHGQIATPSHRVMHLPDHPRLQDALLLPPAGESRAAYFYARPGQEGTLEAYVAAHLGEHFTLIETERALEAGLWGSPNDVTPTTRGRLGDLVLLAKHNARLSTRPSQNDGSTLLGHHGSLTPEEMLVPLLIVPLDQL